MGDEVYVSLSQAAGLVGRTVVSVRRWCRQGRLGRVRWSKGTQLVRLGAVRGCAAEVEECRWANRGGARDREPTAEEVEAVVAEQLACAPEWFWSDHAARNGRAAAEAYRERAQRGRAA